MCGCVHSETGHFGGGIQMSFKALIPGLALLASGSVFAQQTLTCSSDDMRRHYCGADTRTGVQLLRQRSDATCRQGYSWGYDRRGVWVDHGCRADFAIGNTYYGNNNGYGNNNVYGYGNGRYRDRDRDYDRDRDSRYRDRQYGYGNNNPNYGYSNPNYGYGNGGYASTLTCSSDDMRRHYCGANTSGGVQLVRQRSDASCQRGYSWGYDRRGVWVDHGCRADFAVR
jgi:Protein of unknown function (DUF3011)